MYRSTTSTLTLIAAILIVALTAVHPGRVGAQSDSGRLPATMARGNAAHTGEQPGPNPTGAPKLRWTFQTGDRVRSSPAVVGDVVYIGGDHHLYAIDAKTGAEKWRFATGSSVTASPAVVDGVVYVTSSDGYLYAVDGSTGELRWQYRTGAAPSPTVVDGVVYTASDRSMLYALDAATGLERWHFAAATPFMTAPAVVGQSVYLGTGDGSLVALAKQSGTLRWAKPVGVMVLTSPAVAHGIAVVAVESLMLEATDGGEDVTMFGTSLLAVDAETGAMVWHAQLDASISGAGIGMTLPTVSAPAILDGVVYAGSAGGTVLALDLTTGQMYWGASIGGTALSSAAVVEGVVYIGTLANSVVALDSTSGAQLWMFATDYRVISSPAVADGVVYIGSDDGKVYAIGGS